jgi:hypothetical protein
LAGKTSVKLIGENEHCFFDNRVKEASPDWHYRILFEMMILFTQTRSNL